MSANYSWCFRRLNSEKGSRVTVKVISFHREKKRFLSNKVLIFHIRGVMLRYKKEKEKCKYGTYNFLHRTQQQPLQLNIECDHFDLLF